LIAKKLLPATVALFALSLAGCAVRGHSVAVPGCKDAYAAVPDGCYAQKFADRVEVRCHDSNNTYFCGKKLKQ
jgi:hypothetical protein